MTESLRTKLPPSTQTIKPFTEQFKINFWKKVDKTSGCWIWKGSKNKRGYGKMFYKPQTVSAHRVSWILHNGEIPISEELGVHGVCVLHKCDNPSCVNPNHLFLGNHLKNMRDMLQKKRSNHPKGSNNGMAKLAENQVYNIKLLFESGEKRAAIANQFGVNISTVEKIGCGIAWRHITASS